MRPERIVFLWRIADAEGNAVSARSQGHDPDWPDETLVTVTFTENHRVIAVEQQGHGRTADIDRPLSFEQMADDTAAALDLLGVERVDVFGFSNGGNVAMQLAMRHPNKVRRLVVGSAFFTNDGLHLEVRAMFRRPPNPADIPAPLRDDYLRIAPNPENLPRLTTKIMAMLSAFRDWPPDALRAITAPTLLLQANADIARTEHAAEMCRLIPRCELIVLPGGHGTYIGEATSARPGGIVLTNRADVRAASAIGSRGGDRAANAFALPLRRGVWAPCGHP